MITSSGDTDDIYHIPRAIDEALIIDALHQFPQIHSRGPDLMEQLPSANEA